MLLAGGLVNMSTRAMRLKTQARVLACLQAVCPTLSVVKEQSLSASLVRLEKELFPLYLRQGECPGGARGYDPVACHTPPACGHPRYLRGGVCIPVISSWIPVISSCIPRALTCKHTPLPRTHHCHARTAATHTPPPPPLAYVPRLRCGNFVFYFYRLLFGRGFDILHHFTP